MSDAAQRTACAHCGLPVVGRGKSVDEPLYCCVGCRFAASLFQASDGETLTTPGVHAAWFGRLLRDERDGVHTGTVDPGHLRAS